MQPRGKELLERLAVEVLVFDGAMGTMLFQAGLQSGSCPEQWNLDRPEAIQDVHRAYYSAGSQLVETNSFGGTRLKLGAFGLEGRVRDFNLQAARLARAVCPAGCYVAGSMGPTGQLPEPIGDATPEELYESFREQAAALAEGGADILAIETMMVPDEAEIAVRAAKAATDLPVICSMTFQWNRAKNLDRTMWGTSPAEAARRLRAAGADLVGCNCGDGGPDRVPHILAEMREAAPGFLVAYPNAGIPRVEGDKTIYDLSPEGMAASVAPILAAGASILGGCCGSTPDHIRAMAEAIRRR